MERSGVSCRHKEKHRWESAGPTLQIIAKISKVVHLAEPSPMLTITIQFLNSTPENSDIHRIVALNE